VKVDGSMFIPLIVTRTYARDVGVGHLNEFIIFQFILDAQVLGSSNEGFNVTMNSLNSKSLYT